MPYVPRIVSPRAGAEQTRTDTHPVFPPLPTAALPVERKSRLLIQEALAEGGSPQFPPVLRSCSRRESNRDIQAARDLDAYQSGRYFPH